MVLVDTGVWIDHFNVGVDRLVDLLDAGHVVCHRWVLGELLLGTGIGRDPRRALASLDRVPTLPDQVLLDAIDRFGWRGLAWVDLQLILAANYAGHTLWTRDRAAQRAAIELGVEVISE